VTFAGDAIKSDGTAPDAIGGRTSWRDTMAGTSSLYDEAWDPQAEQFDNIDARVREAVLAAIEAPDADAKALWWRRYRAVRAEALARRSGRRLLRVVRG
jgi:hypothetical protein